jgi:hypothetical protein
MRILVIGIILAISWMTSLANGTVSHTKTIASPAPTVTKSARPIVKLHRIPKPKIFRSNPFRVAYFNRHWEENDDIDIDDDDKITGPRRDQYGKIKTDPTPDDPEGDVTPDIEWRLFLIRQAALIKHGIQQA